MTFLGAPSFNALERTTIMPPDRRSNVRRALAPLFIAAVAAVTIVLTVQGWRSRAPAFDLLAYIYSARDFLDTGVLPRHGDTGSYGSYKPPGTAWLMMPSLAFFDDPRLADYVGAGLLHCATLLGVFLLARRHFGEGCAYLSVALYGLSAHALFLAGSLWPNGRPDVFVWIVYFVDRWIGDRDGRYLAAAAAVWGLGMHVDMAVTPALFILPAAWLYYRPPWRTGPLLLAAAIVLVVWSPYLSFQAPRGFADIRSQLLQQKILLGDYRRTWCDPHLQIAELNETPPAVTAREGPGGADAERQRGALNARLARARLAMEMAGYNFHALSPIPGAGTVLLVVTLLGVVAFSVTGAQPGGPIPARASALPSARRTARALGVVGGAVVMALVLRGAVPDSQAATVVVRVARRLAALLALGGFAFAFAPWAVMMVTGLLSRVGIEIQSPDRAERRRTLVLSLLVPWLVLLLVAEPAKPERFWWIWPLQAVFLTAAVTELLPRLGVRPRVVRGAAAILVGVVVANSFLAGRVQAWVDTGWAGVDAEEVQAVDFVASRLRADGRREAAIGYATFIYPFMASYNITNPRYKVGAEFDIFFRLRHGIANTNECAEGIAATDDYRIVQMTPKSPSWAPSHYFRVDHDGFDPLGHVASYRILGRP